MCAKRIMAIILLLCIAPSKVSALNAHQLDDFEDGSSTQGWREGGPSTTAPFVFTTGGPAGEGDGFLANTSDANGGPGGRMVVRNTAQWTGDYLLEGIAGIRTQMANFGDANLYMRIAVESRSALNGRYASTIAITLPPDGVWRELFFPLQAMRRVSGSNSLSEVLADVTELRILSAESGPAWSGDTVVAQLAMDNIRAVPEPVIAQVPLPTLPWLLPLLGLGIMRWQRAVAKN